MSLAQLCNQDSLTFWYATIIGVKLPIATYLINLMKGEVVGVKVSGRVGTTVFEDFV